MLPACGKIIQDSSLSVGYSQYFLDNLEVFMA
ncbi:stringent starvation protein A, partial [Klebsiella pneumoniae]|nr:stringent starvation protein A [Klebsiella pneumoniae]